MNDSITNGGLLATSEKVVGLILSGKQTHTMFSPDKFFGKYAEIVKDLKAGKSKEEIVLKYGETIVQSAEYAAKSVNGLGTELDWVSIQDMAYKTEVIIGELKKALRFAEMGETDKLSDSLRRSTATITSAQRMRSVPANEITDKYEPFMKSGSIAWDGHIGGIPNVGIVVLGAKTYTGKTTVAISVMDNFLQEYPDREVLFVTLEDMNEGWKHRAKSMLGSRSDEFWKRIRVMEFAGSTAEIIEEAARHENIGMIILDYIDYLTKETDMSSYVDIYKTMSTGAKSLAANNKFRSMPIFLLAQFGKTLYKGGVPTQNALPFAGDQFSYQLCMLYHADGDFYSDDDENGYTLPAVKNMGYLIFWKVKNGRPHDPEFPGAIQVPWNSKTGFNLSASGQWYSLAAETKQKIVKKKRN